MENVNLKSHVIKYGLILGAISIIWTYAIYAIDIYLMLSFSLSLIPLLIAIGVGIYAGIELRKNRGGFLSFKEAFLSTFLIFLVSALISTVASVLLFQVIDPSLATTLSDAQAEKMAEMFTRMGMSPDKIDEAIASQKDKNPYSIGGLLMGFLFIAAIYAILALIVGAIVKRKRPDFV